MAHKSLKLYPRGAFVAALLASLLGAAAFALVTLPVFVVAMAGPDESMSALRFASGVISVLGFAGVVGMISLLPMALILPPLATVISSIGDNDSFAMKLLQYASSAVVGSVVGYLILQSVALRSSPFPNWAWSWPGIIWGLAAAYVWRRKMLNGSGVNFGLKNEDVNNGACV